MEAELLMKKPILSLILVATMRLPIFGAEPSCSDPRLISLTKFNGAGGSGAGTSEICNSTKGVVGVATLANGAIYVGTQNGYGIFTDGVNDKGTAPAGDINIGTFTLVIRTRPAIQPPLANFQVIYLSADASSSMGLWTGDEAGTGGKWSFVVGGVAGSWNIIDDALPVAGRDYVIMISYDSRNWTAWINGVRKNSGTFNRPFVFPSAGGQNFGLHSNGSSFPYNGTTDFVAHYNFLFTDAIAGSKYRQINGAQQDGTP